MWCCSLRATSHWPTYGIETTTGRTARESGRFFLPMPCKANRVLQHGVPTEPGNSGGPQRDDWQRHQRILEPLRLSIGTSEKIVHPTDIGGPDANPHGGKNEEEERGRNRASAQGCQSLDQC